MSGIQHVGSAILLCGQIIVVLPKVRSSHVVVEDGVVGLQRQGFLVVLDGFVVVLLPLLHEAPVVVALGGVLVGLDGPIEALGRLGIFLQKQVSHAFLVPQQRRGMFCNGRCSRSRGNRDSASPPAARRLALPNPWRKHWDREPATVGSPAVHRWRTRHSGKASSKITNDSGSSVRGDGRRAMAGPPESSIVQY